jgi:hypothetical protein
MRRISMLAVLLTVLLGGLLVISGTPQIGAQDSTPSAAMAGHPLVGTWIVTEAGGTPAVIAFTSDGIVVDTEIDGGTGVGSWHPTGDRSAALTFVIPVNESGFSGIIVIRATGEVDADGATFTAPYSITGQGADGTVIFSDQGQVTAVRMPVEPVEAMGTPLAGFPTWTPSEEGTPEAGTPTP